MTPQQHQRVEDLFAELLQLPAAQRDEKLESRCPDDLEVRQEVQRLLALDNQTTTGVETALLKEVHGAAVRVDRASADALVGRSIGPYCILEALDEGGFGTVYKAEQRRPIRRIVALKVIKLGCDTKEVIARFNSERQALARMDHPNIAKVLDAGSTDTGRPFFVMEYVAGRAITRFCDANSLSINDRLLLFIQVCDAVMHAHQKAIIHRDIKASNVLAFLQDGKPEVKVIDFGIAKALTSDRLTDMTFNTARGMAIGTFESMSPEQVEGSPDIDTRTDVYSLGALLYEILVGVPPFDRKMIRSATDDELRRTIREVDPLSPSDRLTSMGAAASDTARRRRCDVEALTRQLRQELEWIPLKALRKERDRRYPSAHSLAEDIQNYLEGQPLIAGPESRIYRFKKSLRRNARVVSAVACVMGVLLLGTVGTTIQSIRARRATRTAQASEARALTLANKNQELALAESELLEEANHKAGLGYLERAKFSLAKKDDFAGAMAAGFAVGFDGDNSGPPALRINPLLRKDTTSWREAMGLSVKQVNTRLEWRSPASVHHGGAIRCIALSRDGKMLASASEDETVRLWDLGTGTLLRVFGSLAGEISSVCFSPDGKHLAADTGAGASARSVRIWNITSDEVLNLTGHQALIRSVCYSPDGNILASAAQDNTIRLYAADKFITSLKGHSGEPNSIAFSPDSTRLAASAAAGAIAIWDISHPERATQMQPLQGTHGLVQAVSFSPDGKTLASGSQDGTVGLWDLASFQMRTLEGYGGKVTSVCFSPDGRTLASGSLDRTVRLWDVATGTVVQTLSGDSTDVYSVRISSDGKTLAWGSRGCRIHLWDLTSGKSPQHLEGPDGVVTSVCFSSDGGTLASASGDNSICIWEAATGKVRQTLRNDSDRASGAARPAMRVAFGADGNTLASVDSNSRDVLLWDLATAKPSRTLAGGVSSNAEACLSFSPDGKLLATGGEGNTIRIWDVAAGKAQILDGHAGPVSSVCFSRDGKSLASGFDDSTVRVWDIASGESKIFKDRHTREITCVTFSPDGATLASASGDTTIQLWEVSSGKSRSLQGKHLLAVTSVSFSRDGRMLTSASKDATIQLWDVATGEALQMLRGAPERITSVSFSPDGQMLAAGACDGTVSMWSIASNKEQRKPLAEHTGWVGGVRFSPDGKKLASASYDKTARLWDVKTGQSRLLQGHKEAVFCVGFNRDGSILASGSQDYTVCLWDVATGNEFKPLTSANGAILSLAFSPVGSMLAAGSRDHSIYLWDIATRTEAKFVAHPDAVFCLAYSPDGRILASGSRDPRIRLWDTTRLSDNSPQQPRLLPPEDQNPVHQDRVTGLSFSPDGHTLVSGSWDHSVCIWNLTTGEARKIPVAGGRKNQINCVSFNPDAITFASGGDDGVLRIWDAASGHQLQALHVSDLGIFGLDFSPDGRTLACSGNDYTIHLWDVRPIVPLRQYLQLYRFDGLDLTPLPAVNLYGDSGFRAQTRQRLRRAND